VSEARSGADHGAGMRLRREVLLQTVVYCGVPAASSAFPVAARVLR
jgi:alkylhydroperoxidase/carboxymuconolactone decarboxylase family protein YurZ